MACMTDYLLWRGDLTFRERDFNEVDNLVLCTVCYLPWDGLLPAFGSGEILLVRGAAERYAVSGRTRPKSTDPRPLLRLGALSARFGGAGVSDFVNLVDREGGIQFCAMTFHLDDGSLFIAFRGTDATVTGWREDFSLTYSSGTPAQEAAVGYVTEIAERYPGKLRLGGHSKGGNLAMFAASFCAPALRNRIEEVFSNDGPGLNEKITERPEYVSASGKFRLIIPEESVVGVLMNAGTVRKVIRSSAKGLQQHDPMTWQVAGCAFLEADGQTGNSAFVDGTVRRWLSDMSDREREGLTNLLFDGMEATGADTMGEVRAQGITAAGAIVKNLLEMNGSDQKDVLEAVGKLVRAGGGQLVDGARKSLDGLKGLIDLFPVRPPEENPEDKGNKPAE